MASLLAGLVSSVGNNVRSLVAWWNGNANDNGIRYRTAYRIRLLLVRATNRGHITLRMSHTRKANEHRTFRNLTSNP